MPDFPLDRLLNSIVLSTYSRESLGFQLSAMSLSTSVSAAWPSSNLAIYIPFTVYETITITKLSILNGSAVSGNFDIGIYDAGGARLVSSGSTAQSGTSAIQTVDITDKVLAPGLYYLALAFDNTTGTIENVGVTAIDAEALGVTQQASAFPLPSTATFAAFAQTIVPMVAAHQQVAI